MGGRAGGPLGYPSAKPPPHAQQRTNAGTSGNLYAEQRAVGSAAKKEQFVAGSGAHRVGQEVWSEATHEPSGAVATGPLSGGPMSTQVAAAILQSRCTGWACLTTS